MDIDFKAKWVYFGRYIFISPTLEALYSLSSYHYDLDESFIAQEPASPPDTSKLLVKSGAGYADHVFYELPSQIWNDRVMFLNNSKVIRSRVVLKRAKLIKKSGNEKVFDGEIFFLEDIGNGSFRCMVYPGDYFPVGGAIEAENARFIVQEQVYEGRILKLEDGNVWDMLENFGQMPLPPYIEYRKEKEKDYQTIFAEKRGSLAAPTASLHFTDRVMRELEKKKIKQRFVTLHVGLGTFKNIYEEDIRNYEMHAERIEVPIEIFQEIAEYKKAGQKILAVGTTVTRTLESLPYLWNALRDKSFFNPTTIEYWNKNALGKTPENIVSDVSTSLPEERICFSSKIFIYGDFSWRIVDEIITNFHLPSSTLFMLVSSFIGLKETKKLYEYAKGRHYRFFSFGDAMYLKQ